MNEPTTAAPQFKGRAVTYHRVSTIDQNPTLAREELRRAVALRELELVEEIEETGSGARNDRPGLQRVLELAASGQVTHVLVWKLSRFGRSSLDSQTNIRLLNRAGVTFVCTSQMLESGPRGAGAVGNLLMRILTAAAEFELDTIREQTLLGVARARALGKRLGRPPTWVDLRRLEKMARAGRSVSRMARRLGIARSTVRTYLAKMGVQPAALEPQQPRQLEPLN